MSTAVMLRYAGIALLVVGIALIAGAIAVYLKLDIRGVRDDLAGRARARQVADAKREHGARRQRRSPDAEQAVAPQPVEQVAARAPARTQQRPAAAAAPAQAAPRRIAFEVTKVVIAPERTDVLGNEEQDNG